MTVRVLRKSKNEFLTPPLSNYLNTFNYWNRSINIFAKMH